MLRTTSSRPSSSNAKRRSTLTRPGASDVHRSVRSGSARPAIRRRSRPESNRWRVSPAASKIACKAGFATGSIVTTIPKSMPPIRWRWRRIRRGPGGGRAKPRPSTSSNEADALQMRPVHRRSDPPDAGTKHLAMQLPLFVTNSVTGNGHNLWRTALCPITMILGHSAGSMKTGMAHIRHGR